MNKEQERIYILKIEYRYKGYDLQSIVKQLVVYAYDEYNKGYYYYIKRSNPLYSIDLSKYIGKYALVVYHKENTNRKIIDAIELD